METTNSKKSTCSFGLSSIDLVGGNFSFEFPTFSRKLKTKAGSGLSLVIGLVATIAAILIGYKYFDTSSPRITFSNETGPELTHNLAKELLVPPMTVYMEGAPIQANISRFITFKVIPATMVFDRDFNYFNPIWFAILDYADCKELNDPYYNDLLSKIDDNNNF